MASQTPDESFSWIDIERINKAWNDIENIVRKFPFKVEGFPLSVERINSRIRVCYVGRPISECKAAEKVATVQYMEEFLKHYESEKAKLGHEANIAAAILERYVGKFK